MLQSPYTQLNDVDGDGTPHQQHRQHPPHSPTILSPRSLHQHNQHHHPHQQSHISHILVSSSSSSSVTSVTSALPPSARALALVSRIFIFMIVLESLLLIGTSIAAVVYVYSSDPNDNTQTDMNLGSSTLNTACIAIFSTCGVLYFSLDAILKQHRFQLIAAIFSHLPIVAYVAVHYASADLGAFFQQVSLSTLILVSLCQTVYLSLAYFILKSFGRRMYERLRNSRRELIEAYTTHEIYLSLIKMDAFLQVLLLMLAAFFIETPKMLWISILACGVTVLTVWLGTTAVKTESTQHMKACVALSSLQPVYLAWFLHRVYSSQALYPQYTFEQFVFTIVLALGTRAALLLWSYWVCKNFGKGLKERLWTNGLVESASSSSLASSTRSTPLARKPAVVRLGIIDDTRSHEMAIVPSAGGLYDDRDESPSPIMAAGSHITGSVPHQSSTASVLHAMHPPSLDVPHYDDSIVRSSELVTSESPRNLFNRTRDNILQQHQDQLQQHLLQESEQHHPFDNYAYVDRENNL